MHQLQLSAVTAQTRSSLPQAVCFSTTFFPAAYFVVDSSRRLDSHCATADASVDPLHGARVKLSLSSFAIRVSRPKRQ